MIYSLDLAQALLSIEKVRQILLECWGENENYLMWKTHYAPKFVCEQARLKHHESELIELLLAKSWDDAVKWAGKVIASSKRINQS